MEFKNKVILITGAASGIGRAASMAFAKKGGTIVVSDVNEDGGEETVSMIKQNEGTCSFIKTNVAKFEEVKILMDRIIENYGRLDVAINNAGIGGPSARTVDTSVKDYQKVMDINAAGVFYGMKTQIPIMLEQGGGAIVNTASIAGLRGLPNSIAYSASKFAVVGMTKTAAMEYARYKIRINALCPVFTVSPLFDPDALDGISQGISQKLKAGIPMKRFGNIKEQVDAMIWLCSERSSFVTGLALPVDGGLTA
ncbi:MAG: glucose 1-dehydrogenase [Saprospiraceae bacterium]